MALPLPDLLAQKGTLTKLKIIPLNDSGTPVTDTAEVFEALVNPQTLTLADTLNYNTTAPAGTPAPDLRWFHTAPSTLSFEILFDATGAIPSNKPGSLDGIPIAGAIATAFEKKSAPYDIVAEIKKLKTLTVAVAEEVHRPKRVRIVWGKSVVFDGGLASMSFNIKLFRSDGQPLRATASLSFRGHLSELQQQVSSPVSSPDLTHVHLVKEGDTLPLLAHQYYKDASLYLEVARANGLWQFRRLTAGTTIYFPPIRKTKNAAS